MTDLPTTSAAATPQVDPQSDLQVGPQDDSQLARTGVRYSDLIVEALTRHGERPAFVSAQGDTMSYAQAADETSRLIKVLAARGVTRGSGVAALGANAPHMWLIQAASYLLGARFTGLHLLGAAEEHARLVVDAEIDLLLVDQERAEAGSRILELAMRPATLLVAGESEAGDNLHVLLAAESAERLTPGPASLDDVAWLQYTGGTSGTPKGVMLTHQGMAQQVQSWICSYGVFERPRYLAAAPITHAALLPLLPVLVAGGTVFLHQSFNPQEFLGAIERHRISYAFAVPTMLYALHDSGLIGEFDLSSLETIAYGAAPISPSRLADLVSVLGPVLLQGYAQTESSGFGLTLQQDEHDPAGKPHLLASCGRPAVGVTAAILDSEHRELPDRQVGELCIRSPGVMKGYWKQPDLTAQALAGGWLHTGDVGYRDPEGFFFIVDRSKDMVISGGFNVYPREVEDVLTSHPDVAAAAVIGVPHERWGEQVTACVVLRPGASVEAAVLTQMVREQKGAHYAPKALIFVDTLPVTPVGKIDKKALRARHWGSATDRSTD